MHEAAPHLVRARARARAAHLLAARGFGCAFLCRLSFYPLQEWLGVGESGSGVAASRAWLSGRFMPWTNALCQSSMSFSCVLTVGS